MFKNPIENCVSPSLKRKKGRRHSTGTMWTYWLQGRKQAGTQLERGWAAVGFPFSGLGFPHLKEPRDSGNPRETDVTGPTDW